MVNTRRSEIEIIAEILTLAENGAKTLLIGEFYETIEVKNQDCLCDGCDTVSLCLNCEIEQKDRQEYHTQKVPVSWINIKEIYRKIVKHYHES